MVFDPELLASNDIKPTVQTSNLIEELGQVEYVFSDKTGTLTQNVMEFKYLCAREHEYGSRRDLKDLKDLPVVTNVDFLDKRLFEDLKNSKSPRYTALVDALMAICLCHTVIVDEKEGQRVYSVIESKKFVLKVLSRLLHRMNSRF